LFSGLYNGVNWRKVPYAEIVNQPLIDQQATAERKQYVEEQMKNWFLSLPLIWNENNEIEFVFVPEAFAHNCGVYMEICIDSKRPKDDTIANNGKRLSSDPISILMSQPLLVHQSDRKIRGTGVVSKTRELG
jgi:hypothetical protein